jgi:hypothetical protein
VRFPRSLRFDQRAWRPALPLRPRHGYAVDLHRDLPGQTCETLPGVSPTRTWTEVRTAHQPTSTGLELARFQEALQHRFLTYTVPSCSPSPAPPAVLNRLDFVAAAPALPDVPRVRLPPASPTCHDRPAAESSHLRSKPQRFVAHHKRSDTSARARTDRRSPDRDCRQPFVGAASDRARRPPFRAGDREQTGRHPRCSRPGDAHVVCRRTRNGCRTRWVCHGAAAPTGGRHPPTTTNG